MYHGIGSHGLCQWNHTGNATLNYDVPASDRLRHSCNSGLLVINFGTHSFVEWDRLIATTPQSFCCTGCWWSRFLDDTLSNPLLQSFAERLDSIRVLRDCRCNLFFAPSHVFQSERSVFASASGVGLLGAGSRVIHMTCSSSPPSALLMNP